MIADLPTADRLRPSAPGWEPVPTNTYSGYTQFLPHWWLTAGSTEDLLLAIPLERTVPCIRRVIDRTAT